MIPVSLAMEGVNSYREKAVIEFEPLVAARLFGIFGTVGSGKSTILEAMTLALYGESSRLGYQDRRSYNLLNLRSDRLWIDFVFSVESGTGTPGDRYRFTLEVQRGRKRFDDTGTMKRSAYRWIGGQWEPLPEADGAGVLGLSYDNFKRTTIIPQGRFQEFLQLKPKDRTRMLQELFSLERFDLFNRVAALYNTAQSRLDTVEGALAETSPTVAEDLEAASLEQVELKKSREAIADSEQDARRRRDATVEAVRMAEQLEGHRARLEELDHRRDEITALEERTATLQVVERYFTGALDRENAARERKEREESLLRESRAARDVARANEAKTRTALETREERARGLEELREDAARMEAAAGIVARQIERTQPLEELNRARRTEEESREALRAARAREEEAVERLQSAPAGTITREDIAGGLEGIRRGLEELARLEELDQEDRQETVPPSRTEEELARARREYDAVQVDVHLRHLVENLAEGEPCPLCGSREHPLPREADGHESRTVQEVREKVRALEELRDRRLRRSADRAASMERLHRLVGTEPGDPQEIRKVLAEREEHLQEARARHETLDALQEELETLRTARTQAAERLAATTELRHDRERTVSSLEAVIRDHLDALDERGRELVAQVTGRDGGEVLPDAGEAAAEGIRARAEQTRSEILEIEKALETARADHQAATTALAKEEVRTVELEKRTAAARDEHDSAVTSLKELMNEYKMTDRVALEEARGELLQLESYRRRIDDYHQRRRAARDAIRDLEARGAETALDLETARQDAREAESVVRELEEQRAGLDEILGSLKERIEKLTRQQERRNELSIERDTLSIRVENLKILRNLFKGGGFVNYVAQVFLTELVAAANKRFQRLNRNQLALALREDNEFEVIDFLNGGHRRSIKTLSGGQTFQAALCLALALVDSIDRGGSRFFFLDEGFGSLDAEALREVFETLKDLRREERIVGVISHVETMQEEVDTCLVVTRDEEHGSRIRPSWGVETPVR